MPLKKLSYLFKAFGQSGELDFFFFSSQVHQFVFIFFYIILSIYKKFECIEVTVFLICSTCTVAPATFSYYVKKVQHPQHFSQHLHNKP